MSKILCKRIIMLTLLGCMAQSLQAVTLTVTSLSDSGSGSLRAILAKAHDGDTIVFARSLKNDGSAPLVLSSPISVNKNITIHGDVNGDKNTDITISGGGHTRLFKIESGSKVTLKFLNLIRGYMYFATGTISRMGETSTGGGIYNYGTLTMEYCRMSNHYASHGGGAILNNGGTLNIRGSTFSDNNGGAIYNGGGGKVYIRQSTFKNNVNDFGGAIDSFRSTLELSDSTLVSNRANLGSAIFSDGTTVIRNSTFYGNIAPAYASTVYGDNFTHNATIRLENTVIAGSTGKNCGGSGTYTIDHSWFDDDSCPNGVASGTGATLGTNSGNPELGSLQDNGGYTETMMPSGKSGLINAGNPQTCTVRDQRSAQRVGTCDIGAVEYGGSVPRTLTVTNDESLGPGSLRAILTEANDGDTIVFDPSLKKHTIFMLGSGHAPRHITLDKSVVINGDVDGDHKPDIILSGTGNHNMHTRLLSVNQGKTVTLEGLRLVHGFADYGGAIWNHGTLTINYCRLSYNTAKAGDGVSGAGGAIYNDASGTLIINNTTLDHNTAMSAGGAIQNFKGKVMLMNVTLSDNAGDPSNEDVGAALNNMEGRMTLKNTTLYRTTGNGIGIYGSNGFGSDTTLVNTVIAGSSKNNCAGHGAYHLFGTNWFDDNTCGSSSSGDPKLGGPLSTDSGWALNMPASNSGLIDAGDDDTCLPLDARGYRRPHGDHCDIGAVELGATAPPATEEGADAAAASHGERRRVVP